MEGKIRAKKMMFFILPSELAPPIISEKICVYIYIINIKGFLHLVRVKILNVLQVLGHLALVLSVLGFNRLACSPCLGGFEPLQVILKDGESSRATVFTRPANRKRCDDLLVVLACCQVNMCWFAVDGDLFCGFSLPVAVVVFVDVCI